MNKKDVRNYIINELEKIIAWYNAGKSRLIEEDAPADIRFPNGEFCSWIPENKYYELRTQNGVDINVFVGPNYRRPRVTLNVGGDTRPVTIEPLWPFSKLYRTIVKSFKAIEALKDRRLKDEKQLEMQRFLQRFGELHNKTNYRY